MRKIHGESQNNKNDFNHLKRIFLIILQRKNLPDVSTW